jgi:hypothetical protein
LVGVSAPKPAEQHKADHTPSTVTEPGVPVPGRAPTPEPPESKWTYTSQKDEMRGETTREAILQAEGSLSLDFPYGEQRPEIRIRQSPKFGFDILFGVPSGQIMCHSFGSTHLSIKFDDGPVERFGCTDSSDGSSNYVFLTSPKPFLAKLRKSSRVIVEAEFFQNGLQQSTFDSGNLVWE